MCGWPTLYGKSGRRTDHHILYGSPPVHFRTTKRLRAGLWAREGRWYYVEGERRAQLAGSLCILPCSAGCLSAPGGGQIPWNRTPAAVATARCGRRSTPLGGEASPKATEARGPSGRRHRWGLWIIGRWPAFPSRFPGGAAVRYPLFASVLARSGPPTRGPYAAARQRPRGRPAGITCVRTGVLGSSVGAIGWSRACPRYAGGVAAAGAIQIIREDLQYMLPLRGLSGAPRAPAQARPARN